MKRHKSIATFKAAKLKKAIFNDIASKQTERLIEYAETKIQAIGKKFQAWEDTGNLLDSLCWGVFYKSNRVKMGYYRNAMANDVSILHEYSPSISEYVNGRALAQEFMKSYNPDSNGWVVVFAVLAPYWGYWEAGHYNIPWKTHVKFRVMATFYDEVRNELKPPCRFTFEVGVPKY